MSTKEKAFLFGGLGLFLVAVLAVAAVIVVIDKKHDDAVAAADAAADAFTADLVDFREMVNEQVSADSEDPVTALETAQELAREVPELEEAPDHGKEHSDA